MDSSMISKLEKAKRYATERDRIRFDSFKATFSGGSAEHTVGYQDGKWSCDCEFFRSRGRCSHTMALEIILDGMVEIAYEV